MISSLHIENFALIDTLDLQLPSGLAIITGETGAGKSIILGALGLLMGSRADSRQFRNPENRIVVEGRFTLPDADALRAVMAQRSADSADDEEDEALLAALADGGLVLRREVSPAGRSRAFVNESSVTLRRLGEIASRLVDIHSQRSNSLLEAPSFRLTILDAIAGDPVLGDTYRRCFDRYASLRRELKRRREALAEARRRSEVTAFRLERLRELRPRAGEQQELERRVEILSAAEAIRGSIAEACSLLDGDDTSAVPVLHGAASALRDLPASILDADAGHDSPDIAERLRSVEIEVRDIADTLRSRLAGIEADPALLRRSEQRLEAIYAEEKRFGVSSDDELVRELASLEADMTALADGDDAIADIERDAREAAHSLRRAADALTAARRSAADSFSADILRLARPLGMPNLKFEVRLDPAPRLTPEGADIPLFLCSFNKNQPLRPVQEIASGGEMSRLMLCVKAIMASRMSMPTVIFDEIDTGVSGDIADRMGRMMRSMAADGLQVIAITHLPQVAVMGEKHFRVYKEDVADATLTHVALLSGPQREREIARMLSGSVIDQAAILNARSLLSQE